MSDYISKQVKINHQDSTIFYSLSSFSNFTPIIGDKVDCWCADDDTCSFKVQGFSVKLRMVERTPFTMLKVEGDDGSPMEFAFWIQLKSISEYDTRMRITLRVELNAMMKMMIGGKMQSAVDSIADGIAAAFNGALQPVPEHVAEAEIVAE